MEIGSYMSNGATKDETCEKHGAFVSRHIMRSIWSMCPACSEEARVAEEQRRAEFEKAEEIRRWEARLGYACIPERFRERSLQNYRAATDEQKHALAVATRYAEHFPDMKKAGSGLLFCGRPGTGKTHLAVGIAMYAMKHYNASVLFTTVLRAYRMLTSTYDRKSEMSEADVIRELVYPDLLILDEVGVQRGTDSEKLFMFDVINERYEKRKPTIFLSNLDRDGLKAFLGERVFDRLREDGAEYVSFAWDSFRGAA